MEITTGQKAPATGRYGYVRHLNKVGCTPTQNEMEIPLTIGETAPPHRSCSASVVWRLL